MKLLGKLAILFTGAMASFTMICGTYIAHAPILEASSVNFHMGLAVLTMLCSFGTIAYFARFKKTQ